MNVVFHEEALAEMLQTASYYEEASDGLGSGFLDAVEHATRRMVAFPKAGAIERGDIRKRMVVGFPFTLLYAIEPGQLFVVAVMHQRRRPGYWAPRVRD